MTILHNLLSCHILYTIHRFLICLQSLSLSVCITISEALLPLSLFHIFSDFHSFCQHLSSLLLPGLVGLTVQAPRLTWIEMCGLVRWGCSSYSLCMVPFPAGLMFFCSLLELLKGNCCQCMAHEKTCLVVWLVFGGVLYAVIGFFLFFMSLLGNSHIAVGGLDHI